MEEESVLIDQLEDKLIDHPPQNASNGTTGTLFDDSYQKDLTERASQIFNGNWGQLGTSTGTSGHDNSSIYSFLLTKPILHYLHTDTAELRQELADWFVSSDLSELSSSRIEEPFDMDLAYHMGFHPSLNLEKPNSQISDLYYHILGEFNSTKDEADHLARIRQNCTQLQKHGLFKKALALFDISLQKYILSPEDFSANSSVSIQYFGANIHKLSTIFYFLLSVAHLEKNVSQNMKDSLREVDVLVTIMHVIEAWKQYPTNIIKVRSFLCLFYKFILVEFGDSQHLKTVESLLNENYLVESTSDSTKRPLECSPLDFFTIKENLHDKYPLNEMKINQNEMKKNEQNQNEQNQNGLETNEQEPNELKSEVLSRSANGSSDSLLECNREQFMALNSHSNSLTNLLETPRTNRAHSVMGQLPTPTLHLSTPVTSPPSTPSDFMTGGEKIRKMYHVHQGMPFIYPYEDLQPVPQAILEAERLFENASHGGYSFKQLYQERLLFMKQERGIISGYGDQILDDILNLLHSSHLSRSEIKACRESLERVEHFYSKCMVQFKALIGVMMNVIASNKLDVNLRDLEQELNLEESFLSKYGSDPDVSIQVKTALARKAESIRVKDTTLKAVSGILLFLLNWLKVSHVLKSFYFGTLLLDSQFLTVVMDFISDSFNNNALQKADHENIALLSYEILSSQNKLLNPKVYLPQYDFFKVCQGQNGAPLAIDLVNKTALCRMKHEVDTNGERIIHIRQFNADFCAILTNLFNVTNETLVENMSQRVIMFNETKPTDLLKIILLNFENEDLQTPILQIFKKLTPYQGRKWRASNMDVISRIYLHLRLSLKDDWLCGKDLESDFNSCFDQELALRSLLQFYNMRLYPDQMRCLGLVHSDK